MSLTSKLNELLKNYKLTPRQKEASEKYFKNPQGRAFLPIVDLLLEFGMNEYAIEVLKEGIDYHPTFSAARILLCELLIQKGELVQAWRTLDQAPVSLTDNMKAQQLSFQVAVLSETPNLLRRSYQVLKQNYSVNQDIQKLYDLFEREGIEATKAQEIVRLKQTYPEFELEASEALRISSEESPPLSHGLDDAGINIDRGNIDDYQVMPISEITRSFGINTEINLRKRQNSIELDSLTLAEIYEKQGHFAKALKIYRRLMKVSPSNQKIAQKISQLVKLKEEQTEVDLALDPQMVEKVEEIELIDKKISFYTDMLEKLSHD